VFVVETLFEIISILAVVFEQPVIASVYVNVALPDATPVTTPAFVTVATAVLLLTQVPPVVGDNVVVEPTQTFVPLTNGNTFTVTALVVAVQLVVDDVNVKVTKPDDKPVTTPELVTEATVGLLLTQVPPVVGVNVIVDPKQTCDAELLTDIDGLTVKFSVAALSHPAALVKRAV
jgi:hypothetical protein